MKKQYTDGFIPHEDKKFRQNLNSAMLIRKEGDVQRRVTMSVKRKTFEEYVFEQTYASKRK